MHTPFLNQYATDFTALARSGRVDPVIGREEEVRKLTQVLARREKNNALLIGDPGVGKTAIVEGMAQRIAQGKVPDTILNKRILALDVATLMSGTKYRGEFEQRAKQIVQEITNSNRSIVLFVDEAHSVIQSQGSEGSLNLSDILKPALARGDLQMIGATTVEEYEKYFKTDLSLDRRFQIIKVSEPLPEETLTILHGVKDKYREYHRVEFTDAALEAAVNATKDIGSRKLPDKALDALDEAAAMVKVSHLHPAFSKILYKTAVTANPKVADMWAQIQNLDKKITEEQSETLKSGFIRERERLENEISEKGFVVVDSGDIEQVVKEWLE